MLTKPVLTNMMTTWHINLTLHNIAIPCVAVNACMHITCADYELHYIAIARAKTDQICIQSGTVDMINALCMHATELIMLSVIIAGMVLHDWSCVS